MLSAHRAHSSHYHWILFILKTWYLLLKWNLATFGTITNFKTFWFLSYLPWGNWNRKLHHDQGIIHIHYFNGGKFEYSIGLIVILNTCNTCISLIDFSECSVEPDFTSHVWLHFENESARQAVWYHEGYSIILNS